MVTGAKLEDHEKEKNLENGNERNEIYSENGVHHALAEFKWTDKKSRSRCKWIFNVKSMDV